MGCGGTENNFITLAQCIEFCVKSPPFSLTLFRLFTRADICTAGQPDMTGNAINACRLDVPNDCGQGFECATPRFHHPASFESNFGICCASAGCLLVFTLTQITFLRPRMHFAPTRRQTMLPWHNFNTLLLRLSPASMPTVRVQWLLWKSQ